MSFFDKLGKHQQRIALIFKSVQWTYEDLVKHSDEFSANFKGKPLVFILCTNTPASVIGYLGCLRKRAVPLLISASIDVELLHNLCSIYSPDYIWAPNFTNISSLEKYKRGIYSLEGYQLYHFGNSKSYKEELYPELALLLMTSGSTGSPLLVRISYKNLISNTEAICDSISISEKHKPITTLPMNYTYGLSVINTHLHCGATVLLTDESVISKEFWDLFKLYDANSLAGVPYTYQMIFRLGFDRLPLSNIRLMTQAGGKLEDKLIQFYAEKCMAAGINFVVMYGQTEATARMSYLPATESVKKAGSIGIPIKGGHFKVMDTDGSEIVEPFKQGELYYIGDNVTLGYASSYSDLCKGDDNRGILATGDIAMCDNDGFFYITGRKKRFLKVFGNRIGLDEIENILKSKGYNCFVVGEDNMIRVCSENKEYSPEIIINLLSRMINIHRTAIKYYYLEQIPRNEFGKVQYALLNKNLNIQ